MKCVYVRKYEDIVNSASLKYKVEPELIYAIIKSESGFNPNAKSSAGALGLMQITPQTFDWLKGYTKENFLSYEMLLDPKTNINYGTLFISILMQKYNSENLALCAYNAGMGTVERWIKEGKILYSEEDFEKIPYKETRQYLKKIEKCKSMYKELYFN